MNINNDKHTIRGVNLISTSSCNLNCEFCFLNKNKSYSIYNKELEQAWANGTYIKNVKKVFKRLNQSELNVEHFELWGGETLLNIATLLPELKKVFLYFKNIQEIKFSTNWLIDIDAFFDFIKLIDNSFNHHIQLTVQLSIDGPDGVITQHGHTGTMAQYRANIDKFANLINNTQLKNVYVTLVINSTIGKDLYISLFKDGTANMIAYVQEMMNFCTYCQSRLLSKHVEFPVDYIFPGCAVPYACSVQDGLDIAMIARKWEWVNSKYFHLNPRFDFFETGIGDLTRESYSCSNNTECCEFNSNRTILYDGTIVCCSGCFINGRDYYIDEVLAENNISEYYASKFFKNLEYNPLKLSDKELEDVNWYILDGVKNNKNTYRMYSFALALEMAEIQQIPYKYFLDKELLFKHVEAIAGLTTCQRENARDTYTFFIKSPSCFRRYLNGLIEYRYDNIKLQPKHAL